MPDSMPRVALAFAGIVAILAISLGIWDYVQQHKQANPSAAVSTTNVATAKSKNKSNRKTSKRTSAKMTRERLSPTPANVSADAAQDSEQQLRNREFAETATTMLLKDVDPNASRLEGSKDVIESSNRNNRLRKELDVLVRAGSSACLPLPNGTGIGYVDAPYYDNWAGEYCDR